MRIGMVGLGRMGGNMVTRLLEGGHEVVAYDRNPTAVERSVGGGSLGADSLEGVAKQLQPPRAIWVMVPAGKPTEDTVNGLAEVLEPGDLIIDGGNTKYTDDMRRAEGLKARGIHYMDVGTSGGVWGLKVGYCLMAGGEAEDFARVEPVLRTLAPPSGYLHCGPVGSGHFVKMIHNGIEYGMMQAYAEGFEILHASRWKLDLEKIAKLWMQGSVVRSWLLELIGLALEEDPELKKLAPWVEDSGEGRWTVEESINLAVPAPVIALSLYMRFRSRQPDSFSGKMLAAMRHEFGGHPVKTEGS